MQRKHFFGYWLFCKGVNVVVVEAASGEDAEDE